MNKPLKGMYQKVPFMMFNVMLILLQQTMTKQSMNATWQIGDWKPLHGTEIAIWR